LQGSLTDFPLPALVRSLDARHRTGRLTVADRGEIWLYEGRVYLATTMGSPSLPAVLYGADVGPLEEIEVLFADADDRSVLGRILAAHPQREPMIRRLLHEYNLNALFELLLPSSAAFKFESGVEHRIGPRLAVDTGTLLAQAEHRVDVWRRIATRIRSIQSRFRLARTLPDSDFERVVTAEEWRILALLDGRTTVAEVIAETGDGAFRVCSTVYRLLLEGLVTEADEV
jgi:hypothetical protein